MESYKNLSGDSGVEAFQIEPNSIIVRFKNGSEYEYNSYKPGQYHVTIMQGLARQGRGLGTYINKEIQTNYYRKIRR